MRKSFLAGAAFAAFALSGAAHAADLPSRRGVQSDYYAPPPVFSWTGFYLGLNLGYGWGSFTNGSDQLFGKPSGFVGGLTGGFNWQATQNIVVGIEADWGLANVNDRSNLPFFGFSGEGKLNSLATIRPRVGFSADRALIYLTGGLALGSVSANVNDWRFVPFFASTSSVQAGLSLGGGLEYAFTDHISAKAEYLFTSLSSQDAFAWTPYWMSVGMNTSVVRTGLNYRF